MRAATPDARPFSEKLAFRARRLLTQKLLERVSLVTILFLVVDILITYVGSYIGWISSGGASMALLLSNLLFLEGSAILAIGIYIAVAKAWSEPPKKTEPQQQVEETAVESEDVNPNPRYSTLMIFVGAILIVISIAVGTLFY